MARGKPRKTSMQKITRVRNRFATGFPDAMFTKLKYYENNYTFSLAAGAPIARIQMAANDPRDPYLSIGGKTALNYDMYCGIYQWCRVSACKITVSVNKITTTSTQSVIFALLPRPSPTAVFTDIDDVCAQPRVKIMRVRPTTIGGVQTFSLYIPIHVILQFTKLQYNSLPPSSSTDGQLALGPSNIAPIDIYYAKTDESTGFLDHQGTVKVVYYCKFYHRLAKIQAGEDVEDAVGLDAGEVAKPTAYPSTTLPF